MSKILTLINQTSFLLEQEEKGKQFIEGYLHSLLDFIDVQLVKSKGDQESVELLQKISDQISGQAQTFSDQVEEDIRFLKDQHESFKDINQIKDENRAQSLLNMLVDDDYEILDMKSFKENILKEKDEAKEQFCRVIDDVRNAIDEGKLLEINMLLEDMIDDSLDESEDDEEEEEIDEELLMKTLPEKLSPEAIKSIPDFNVDFDVAANATPTANVGGCGTGGGCCGSSCQGCPVAEGGSKGADIFSFMKEYDEVLEEEKEKKMLVKESEEKGNDTIS